MGAKGARLAVWVAAYAQGSLADPAGSGVIVSAVRWLEGTLLGTIATVVAVIAVASVGFLMLTGRINWRYGATVILGCFILFGAASIVAGIQSTASLGN
jgi:type IV secretion system protein VirB2